MSAPETNIEKQTKNHGIPLMGIGLAVGTAVLLFAGWLVWVAAEGETPREATPGAETTPEAEVLAPASN